MPKPKPYVPEERQYYTFTVTVTTHATYREAMYDRELVRNIFNRNLPWGKAKVGRVKRAVRTRKPNTTKGVPNGEKAND